jgi:hypothetical protein
MQKTSVFTSLTMLLSVAHIGFAAEAAQSADQEEREREGRYIAEHHRERIIDINSPGLKITPGNTRFELTQAMLPSIPEIDPSKQLSTKINGTYINFDSLFDIAKITRAICTAKTSISSALALTSGKLGASVVNPTMGLAASAALSKLCQNAFSEYIDRCSSLPHLQTYFYGNLGDQPYFIAASTNPNNKTYWGWDGEKMTLNPFPQHPLCYEKREFCAALPIEGIPIQDQIPYQITIPGLISARIEDVVIPGVEDSQTSQLVISHCRASCRGQDCGESGCGLPFQTCLSPEGMKIGSFTMNPDGQRICIGFTDGTIGILEKMNGYDPTNYRWRGTYERKTGKPFTQVVKEHKERLTGLANKKNLFHVGGAAAAAASFIR